MMRWAIVPARGGSKGIHRKNLAKLDGVPLLHYGILALLDAGCVDRILCSTDDDEIANEARRLGCEIDVRPPSLATDDASITDVALELFERRCGKERKNWPDIALLVQPTSPFVLPEHLSRVVDALAHDATGNSAQTVTPVVHNHHAWNQRVIEDGRVSFRYREERRLAVNKQKKPVHYVFGNTVAVRPAALRPGDVFFVEPSIPIVIPPPYDFDVDTEPDLALAEAILARGLVRLPHILKGAPPLGKRVQ